VIETCAQQHVKLFRRDKLRLRRSMSLLQAYVDEKRDLLDVLGEADVRFASYDTQRWQQHWDRQQRRTLGMLDVLAEMGDGMMAGPRYGFALFSSLGALEKCEHSIMQINERRAEWRAALECKFPPTILLTIVVLMLATMLCFVIRADAVASGAMLLETPVRLLFCMMVFSFALLLQIMIDLADPFAGGTYAITLGSDLVQVASRRVRSALILANTVEPFDADIESSSIRPAMDMDDQIAMRLAKSENSSQ